jgi:hypothetical protein
VAISEAYRDAGQALDMLTRIHDSDRVKTRLRDLAADAGRYKDRSEVRGLRDRIRATTM